MGMVLSLAVLFCMFRLVKFYWEKRHFFKMASTIPNSKTGLLGGIGDMAGKSIDGCFQRIIQYFRDGPEIQKGWFGTYLVVAVSKPEHLEIVMTNKNSLDRGSLLKFAECYVGKGLVTASGNLWRKNRKLINPAFNQKVLNSFIPIFAQKCDILVGNLEKHVGQHDIDIRGILSSFALDTICETAMGATVEAQTNDNRYYKSLHKLMEIIMSRVFNIFCHPQIIFDMTKNGKLCSRLVTEMNGFSQRVITEQRAIFEQKKRGEYITVADSQYKTILDMLLEESCKGGHFTDKQLLDEVNTFISAGTDTTALTLSNCFLMLGMHPEFQQKMYEEAAEVLGEDRYATKEDLTELKFTEMFIKETLRIFPVIALTSRTAIGDIKIDDNLVIPKGAMIWLGIVHLHRNPKYWEEPLKFNPLRFLPEEWAKKHPFSYIPFSGGPRNCIGARYAMMNMKLILSKIVREFIVKTDYTSVEEVELTNHFVMFPSDGFKISLELRE